MKFVTRRLLTNTTVAMAHMPAKFSGLLPLVDSLQSKDAYMNEINMNFHVDLDIFRGQFPRRSLLVLPKEH